MLIRFQSGMQGPCKKAQISFFINEKENLCVQAQVVVNEYGVLVRPVICSYIDSSGAYFVKGKI